MLPHKKAYCLPQGDKDLSQFKDFVREGRPFTFVRFSDGEVEVLRNRKLIIADGITEFRGRKFSNQFPTFDQKRFDPMQGQQVRRDLLAAAVFSNESYFKGIPTSHNDAINDREFLLRLNGGFAPQMTFSDLFLNSNFLRARSDFFPFVASQFSNLRVVGNWRCKLSGYLAKGELIPIPDDFFSSYLETLAKAREALELVPQSSLVLSSASSLSNVLGHQLRLSRPDLTFLDVGTALNDVMGLPLGTRAYHKLINPRALSEKLAAWYYQRSKEYKLKW